MSLLNIELGNHLYKYIELLMDDRIVVYCNKDYILCEKLNTFNSHNSTAFIYNNETDALKDYITISRFIKTKKY